MEFTRYPIEVEEGEDGSARVSFPDFPGLLAYGDHLGEAYMRAEEVLCERLVRHVELGVQPPPGSACGKQVLELGTQSLRRLDRAIKRQKALQPDDGDHAAARSNN